MLFRESRLSKGYIQLLFLQESRELKKSHAYYVKSTEKEEG
jgi:hypothetical protein